MRLLTFIPFAFCSLLLFSCGKDQNYEPETYMNEQESRETLLKILPYFAKLPKGYTYERRFATELDTFYNKEIEKYNFLHYYISEEDSFHYFMVTRPAPSLYEKRTAIAGKFKKDKNNNIAAYEESFWTFKMKVPELEKKGKVLFTELAEGKDLSAYMPGNRDEEWIEFPDHRVTYNKADRKWDVHNSH